jgi:hypothetical protein
MLVNTPNTDYAIGVLAGGDDVNVKLREHLSLIMTLDGIPAQQLNAFAERAVLDFEIVVQPHVNTFGPLLYSTRVSDDRSIQAGTEIREGAIAVERCLAYFAR